jgi:hypothetical protein
VCAQFPGGLEPGALSLADLYKARKWRKRALLDGSLRQPLPDSKDPATTSPAPNGRGAYSTADADVSTYACNLTMWKGNVHLVHHCLSALISAVVDPDQRDPVQFPPSLQGIRSLLAWLARVQSGQAVVLDTHAVETANAKLEALNLEGADEDNTCRTREKEAWAERHGPNEEGHDNGAELGSGSLQYSQHVREIVRAAKQEGQGLIVFKGPVPW